MPTTAMSSPNIASVMPALRAEAVWLAMQYSHPLVTLTATYNNSLTNGLNAPSAITSLTLSQVRLSSAGSFARYFQKLLTSSIFRLRLMSSKTARTCGGASAYSIGPGRLIDLSPMRRDGRRGLMSIAVGGRAPRRARAPRARCPTTAHDIRAAIGINLNRFGHYGPAWHVMRRKIAPQFQADKPQGARND